MAAHIAFSARVTPHGRPKNAPRVARRLRTFLNGSGYIGDGFWHLFVVDVPSGATRQITDGEWHHFSPAWSPDGRRLAFVTTRREEWDLEWIWDIYTSDADGGDLRQLTHSTRRLRKARRGRRTAPESPTTTTATPDRLDRGLSPPRHPGGGRRGDEPLRPYRSWCRRRGSRPRPPSRRSGRRIANPLSPSSNFAGNTRTATASAWTARRRASSAARAARAGRAISADGSRLAFPWTEPGCAARDLDMRPERRRSGGR